MNQLNMEIVIGAQPDVDYNPKPRYVFQLI